jgi:hypothetical protein
MTTIDRKIRNVVATLPLMHLHQVLVNWKDNTADAFHWLVGTVCDYQPHPGDRYYHQSDLMGNTIARPAVWRALLKRHSKKVYQHMQYTFNIPNGVPQAGATAGWLWEAWSHCRITEGGKFALLPMIEDGDYLVRADRGDRAITLNLTRMTTEVFSTSDLNSSTLDPVYLPPPTTPRLIHSAVLQR